MSDPAPAERARRLYQRVRELAAAQRRRRVPLDAVRALYLDVHPEAEHAGDQNRRLVEVLHEGQRAGAWTLPAAAWDRRGTATPLPRYVVVDVANGPSAYPVGHAWSEPLRFAAELTHPVQIQDALAIDAFLKARRGQPLTPVPCAERSLEIFGDEKRLDALRSGDALFGGRLGLADLGARPVHPPLAWAPVPEAPPGAPLVIVENHASYWTLVDWSRATGRFRAVVWGGGKMFQAAHYHLDAIRAEAGAGSALYLGDLDPHGLEIADSALQARQAAGLAPFAPWRAAYRWLATHGRTRPLAPPPTEAQRFAARRFLGDDADPVLAHWDRGHTVPQEALGRERLGELAKVP